ncbi:hypothetical protein MY4824_007643 [Beauveria thailandica]
MRAAVVFSLTLVASAATLNKTQCHFKPSPNATTENYPGAKCGSNDQPLYDLNRLSEVPIATICNSDNSTEELDCARKYINAIDEQIAYLYARRLGYAAVAGHSKYRSGANLNDPTRNAAVAQGMALRVLGYGGNLETGRIMGGEGCQIYASLEYEADNIQTTCDSNFEEQFSRTCN